MDSLDAQLRWGAKRDAMFQKINKLNARTMVLPQRAKVRFRVRPGEVTREEFGSWMGAVAPESGAVNEFRTKMYQSELRGLQNRIKMNLPAERTNRIVTRATFPADPPAYPGIQLFFQNTVDQSPLPGLRGGALTQLPPTAREYRRVEDTVRKNLRQQVTDITAMRAGQPFPAPPTQVLTALDEAKLQIATGIEMVAQQLLRGIYTTDILRDLTTVSTAIARNAPLMDAPALSELLRYVSDMAQVLRANAKNTGKEVAEENLLVFDDDAMGFFDPFGNLNAPGAQPRDLDKGVKVSQKTAEAIYARVEALADFLKKQFSVAERPIPERIQVARASLPSLGTNIDRKSYPAEVRKRLNLEETQRAQADAPTAVGELIPADAPPAPAVPTLDVGELAGLDLPSAMRPAPERSAPFEDIPADEERRAQIMAEIDSLFARANEARREGDRDTEEEIVQQAFELFMREGMEDDARALASRARRRGLYVGVSPASASSASAAAPAPAPAPAPASQFPQTIRVTMDDLAGIRSIFANELGSDPVPSSKIPRNSDAVKQINAFLKENGSKKKINSGKGTVSFAQVKQKLSEANMVVVDEAGDEIAVSEIPI
jgi:hypothetical protein